MKHSSIKSLIPLLISCAVMSSACTTPGNIQEITIETKAKAIRIKVFDIFNQKIIEANITEEQMEQTELASNNGIVFVKCIGYESDAAPNEIVFACNPIWTTNRDTVYYPGQPVDALGYPIAAFGFKMDKNSKELPSSLTAPNQMPFTLNCLQVSFLNPSNQPSVSLHTCLTP